MNIIHILPPVSINKPVKISDIIKRNPGNGFLIIVDSFSDVSEINDEIKYMQYPTIIASTSHKLEGMTYPKDEYHLNDWISFQNNEINPCDVEQKININTLINNENTNQNSNTDTIKEKNKDSNENKNISELTYIIYKLRKKNDIKLSEFNGIVILDETCVKIDNDIRKIPKYAPIKYKKTYRLVNVFTNPVQQYTFPDYKFINTENKKISNKIYKYFEKKPFEIPIKLAHDMIEIDENLCNDLHGECKLIESFDEKYFVPKKWHKKLTKCTCTWKEKQLFKNINKLQKNMLDKKNVSNANDLKKMMDKFGL